MNTDDLLKQQIELTKKIIDRMDTMIDAMKKEMNIVKPGDMVHFYTPSGKKEWYGIPDSTPPLDKTNDILGDGHSYPENDDNLDQMDTCLVRNVAKAQRKTILDMEIEMEALRAIIDDMREQIKWQATRELEIEKEYSVLAKDYDMSRREYIELNKKYKLLAGES